MNTQNFGIPDQCFNTDNVPKEFPESVYQSVPNRGNLKRPMFNHEFYSVRIFLESIYSDQRHNQTIGGSFWWPPMRSPQNNCHILCGRVIGPNGRHYDVGCSKDVGDMSVTSLAESETTELVMDWPAPRRRSRLAPACNVITITTVEVLKLFNR